MTLYERMTTGVYTIAEMSANHAGKLENALEIVRQAKKAGADCLKIQTYTADTLTIDCDNEYFKIHGGLWDGYNLYDLYQNAYTPWDWQPIIKAECEKLGLDFLSTPFDFTAVDFLEKMGVNCYKIASFELVDIPLIEYTAAKKKPMIISCGMGSPEEITDAVEACRRVGNNQIILLKCCSEYPANFADMRLATILDMQKRFGVPVGLSDHSAGSLAPVVAVGLNACVIEKHVCLSRKIKNPDSEFSMEIDEFSRMVSDVKDALAIKGEVSYQLTVGELDSKKFRRSLFAVKDIKKGEPFTKENVRSIRPSDGLAPKYYKQLLTKNAWCEIAHGTPIGAEYTTDE
ncbi:MAG: pseudaminic acid synthase [Pygmaiobacter sp.]